MGEHAARDPERTTHRILDRVFPLSRFSAEDRLQVLLFHLCARAGAEEEDFRRTCTEHLGTPEPVITAVVHGDIPALLAAVQEAGGWPVLASLLAYGGGLAADYGSLAAAHGEFEEIAMDPGQRHLLPLSRSMLTARGYQHSAETFLDNPTEAAADPRLAGTHEELVEALACLRTRAGEPSLREMAERALEIPDGADPLKHQPRSYNTLNKVLKVENKGPHLASVLAFVRGCGVLNLEELAAWEEACVRIALAKRRSRQPPPRPDGGGGKEGWRSPTGPNPSMA